VVEDVRRAREDRLELGVVDVPLADQELLEDVVAAVEPLLDGERVIDREHRLERPDLRRDRIPRRERELAGRRGDHRERLVDVHHRAADRDQRDLVVLDQPDRVRARDVGRGRDDDARPVERRVALERLEHAVGDLRPYRRAVPDAGHLEVVEVTRLAGDLGNSIDTRERCADGCRASIHRWI
jgi:hypothetical protein